MQAMFTRPLAPWMVTVSKPPRVSALSVMESKAFMVRSAVFSSVVSLLARIFPSLKMKVFDTSGHAPWISSSVLLRAKAYTLLFMFF